MISSAVRAANPSVPQDSSFERKSLVPVSPLEVNFETRNHLEICLSALSKDQTPVASKQHLLPEESIPFPLKTPPTHPTTLPTLDLCSLDEPAATEAVAVKAVSKTSITPPEDSPKASESITSFESFRSLGKVDPLLTRYVKLAPIGKGRFSKVWEAHEAATGVLVAFKETPVKSSKEYALLEREVSILRTLDHPGIIKVREFSFSNSHFYTILELGPKATLSRAVGHLKLIEIQIVAAKLALVLEHLQHERVLHRDIKLDNILIRRRDLSIRLVDFAFAETLVSEILPTTQMGSYAYISPEMAAHKGYGFPSQWWSFAVCLYILCFETYPFGGSKGKMTHEKWVASIYSNLASRKAPHFPTEHPNYSPELEELLMRLFDFNPETRANFEDLRRHPWFSEEIKWDTLFSNLT